MKLLKMDSGESRTPLVLVDDSVVLGTNSAATNIRYPDAPPPPDYGPSATVNYPSPSPGQMLPTPAYPYISASFGAAPTYPSEPYFVDNSQLMPPSPPDAGD